MRCCVGLVFALAPSAFAGEPIDALFALRTARLNPPGSAIAETRTLPSLRVADRFESTPATASAWVGLGVAPAFCACRLDADGETAELPLAATAPTRLGFSCSEEWRGRRDDGGTPGVTDIAAVVALPLAFVPARFGRWSFSAGAHLLLFSDAMKAVNGGDGHELVGAAVLSLRF